MEKTKKKDRSLLCDHRARQRKQRDPEPDERVVQVEHRLDEQRDLAPHAQVKNDYDGQLFVGLRSARLAQPIEAALPDCDKGHGGASTAARHNKNTASQANSNFTPRPHTNKRLNPLKSAMRVPAETRSGNRLGPEKTPPEVLKHTLLTQSSTKACDQQRIPNYFKSQTFLEDMFAESSERDLTESKLYGSQRSSSSLPDLPSIKWETFSRGSATQMDLPLIRATSDPNDTSSEEDDDKSENLERTRQVLKASLPL